MRPALAFFCLIPMALAVPVKDTKVGSEKTVRSLDDLAHMADGEVIQLKRVKRCEVAAAAPKGAIVNARTEHPDCEEVPTFITNW